MYDFMAFGYYAKWIARAFFPLHSQINSLLLTLATFGAGLRVFSFETDTRRW